MENAPIKATRKSREAEKVAIHIYITCELVKENKRYLA
jgi:hypothetical protein